MTVAELQRMQVPEGPVVEPSAVLKLSCEGYGKGTTGRITGSRQGCLVFRPEHPEDHARWAHTRQSILVPPAFIATL
jgi:hypothetical protein